MTAAACIRTLFPFHQVILRHSYNGWRHVGQQSSQRRNLSLPVLKDQPEARMRGNLIGVSSFKRNVASEAVS